MRWSAATVVLTLTAGCASSGTGTPPAGTDAGTDAGTADARVAVFDPEQVDQGPELVRCGDWLDHGRSRERWAVIQFVVTATGQVRDPRVIQTPPRVPEVGLEAVRIARTCTFRPAMAGGKAVAVRWSKRFDFPEAA